MLKMGFAVVMLKTKRNNKSGRDDLVRLLPVVQRLVAMVKELRCFEGTELGDAFAALQVEVVRAFDGKVVPELATQLQMPLLVALLGGTNTGKSTVFNALAGVLLSDTRVTAGATKHPLIYVHERWRDELLGGAVFPGLECVELVDPAELVAPNEAQRLFVHFHERAELEQLAYLDSPDLDSLEPHNREKALLVQAHADVCLYVTTPHKYKDRVLVSDVLESVKQRKQVVVLFNQVEEALVYRTVADDMQRQAGKDVAMVGFLPIVGDKEPAVVLAERAREQLDAVIDLAERKVLKTRVVRHALDSVVARVRAWVARYRAEAGHKAAIFAEVQRQLERNKAEYARDVQLPFPEAREALVRQLAATELARQLPKAKAETPRLFDLLRHAIAYVGTRLSSFFVQGLEAAGAQTATLETMGMERDAIDLQRIQQLALLLRSRIDARLREQAPTSQLSLALFNRFFSADDLEHFEARVAAAHAAALEKSTPVGKVLLDKVAAGSERRTLPVLANLAKATGGGAVAWVTSGLGFWDLLFFPLGFVGGGYLVASLLYLGIRSARRQFDLQRQQVFADVVQSVLVGPFVREVEAVASEEDMDRLEALCAQLAGS